MKLSELKRIVPAAEARDKVPTLAGVLASGASIVAKDLIDEESDVTVFSNGYVIYRAGNHATVFPLHDCGDYAYEQDGKPPVVVPEEVFDSYNWSVRLIAEGEDRLEYNQKQHWKRTTVSYSGVAEDWALLADSTCDAEALLLEQERLQEQRRLVELLLKKLTKRQRIVVIECYLGGRQHKDVASQLGISRQAVTDALKKALVRMRKEYDKM